MKLCETEAAKPEPMVPAYRIREIYPTWPWGAAMTHRLAREGRLDCVRVGRRRFFTAAQVEAFIRRHATDWGHAGW